MRQKDKTTNKDLVADYREGKWPEKPWLTAADPQQDLEPAEGEVSVYSVNL